MKKKVFFVILILLVLVGLAFYAKPLKRFEAQFLNVFDTVTQVVGYSKSKDAFTKQAEHIEQLLTDYHQLYDIYNDYEGINNLKTINDYAGIKPVEVDEKIIDMLAFGKQAYELTGGKVNIVYGSVLSLWHAARAVGIDDPEHAVLPDQEQLTKAARHTDINQLIIDRENGTVYLADQEMRLDVGAIAKGYAVEQVCRQLASEGEKHLLLSVGGNVRAIGARGDKKPWVVPVESPFKENDQRYICTTGLSDMSLISSGDYQRYYVVDGVTYHHIIDPQTLYPANHHRAVTILCKDSGLADALSTGVFLMTLEEGQSLVEQMDGVEALWVEQGGSVIYSSGFQSYLEETK